MTDESPESKEASAETAAALEHFRHWWREPLAGIACIVISCFDTWEIGAQKGFSQSLDEILLIAGVTLLAGTKNLFGATNGNKMLEQHMSKLIGPTESKLPESKP